MKYLLSLLFFGIGINLSSAQQSPWQQEVKYQIEIDFDVNTHQFTGEQQVIYINNSPDTLNKLFFHLYFNAFQPGSMMDIRSRTIEDPDSRVKSRISQLDVDEIGYHIIKWVKHGTKNVDFKIDGTIMEVFLNVPLPPNKAMNISMEYESQVPVQIRRSGRNNKQGVAYSMTQWYPKVAEYDVDGWHANPYVGREYHGVWGDFDVKINIDKAYTLGGTGYLQNAQSIGKGYEDQHTMVKSQDTKKNLWHFKAPRVHDFAWAADTDYVHKIAQVPDGPTLHFLYKNDSINEVNWTKLQPYAIRCFELMKDLIGPYPYEQYSVIQGGDGGMEYPMATLITSSEKLGPLISVTVHEAIHSWFQGLLATNESKYAWMDEGFTSYAQQIVLDSLYHKKRRYQHQGSYAAYFRLVESGKQEPLSTHADHFSTNRAYGTAAYSMGSIFLHQLSTIIGQENLEKGLKTYFEQWKYKHPTPTDIKRIFEKQSGIELDWYFEYWIHATKHIDYSIGWIDEQEKSTAITLLKKGEMPMPLDVLVRLKNGKRILYHIPLRIMRGHKSAENDQAEFKVLESWPWTYPEYTFEIDASKDEIESIEIDPTRRMADINRKNNRYPFDSKTFVGKLIKKK